MPKSSPAPAASTSLPDETLDPDLPTTVLEDMETYDKLVAPGFSGEAWQSHAQDVFGYAHTVFRAWARKGELFAQLKADKSIAEEQRDTLPTHRHLTDEQVDDLIGFLFVRAMPVYKKRLSEGKWQVGKGRSLRSYAVQQVKFQLARHFWEWQEEQDATEFKDELQADAGLERAIHGDV